jgi:hypothetical protein
VGVGFLYLNDDTLLNGPITVRVVHRAFNLMAVESLSADDRNPPVHPHHFGDPRDEEDEADMGVFIHVEVGLKQLIPGHIGKQQMPVIQNSDEAWLAPFRRCVASALAVTGGHHQER